MNLTQTLIHAPALKMMMMMMTGFGLALRISTSALMYVWTVILKQVALTALMSCVMIWVGRALEKMESYTNMTFNHCRDLPKHTLLTQLLHHSSIILCAQNKQAWSTEHSKLGIGSVLSKTKSFN